MADEEGFEPPIRVTPYKRFRVARIQPLCHSSVKHILIKSKSDFLQQLFSFSLQYFNLPLSAGRFSAIC